MKVIKNTAEYTVYQKRTGRYAVKSDTKGWINEADKVAILIAEGLLQAPKVKAPEPVEPAAEADEASATEAVATETEAEAAPESES